MSKRMYRPDKKSKTYFYVLFAFATFLGWVFYVYTRPVTIVAECSMIAEQTNTLPVNNRYHLNPEDSFNLTKVECLKTVLAAKETK